MKTALTRVTALLFAGCAGVAPTAPRAVVATPTDAAVAVIDATDGTARTPSPARAERVRRLRAQMVANGCAEGAVRVGEGEGRGALTTLACIAGAAGEGVRPVQAWLVANGGEADVGSLADRLLFVEHGESPVGNELAELHVWRDPWDSTASIEDERGGELGLVRVTRAGVFVLGQPCANHAVARTACGEAVRCGGNRLAALVVPDGGLVHDGACAAAYNAAVEALEAGNAARHRAVLERIPRGAVDESSVTMNPALGAQGRCVPADPAALRAITPGLVATARRRVLAGLSTLGASAAEERALRVRVRAATPPVQAGCATADGAFLATVKLSYEEGVGYEGVWRVAGRRASRLFEMDFPTVHDSWRVADFTGDGVPDVLFSWHLHASNDHGLVLVSPSLARAVEPNDPRFMGDRRDEALAYEESGAVGLLYDDAVHRWDGRAFVRFEQGFPTVRAAVRAERTRYDGATRALVEALAVPPDWNVRAQTPCADPRHIAWARRLAGVDASVPRGVLVGHLAAMLGYTSCGADSAWARGMAP